MHLPALSANGLACRSVPQTSNFSMDAPAESDSPNVFRKLRSFRVLILFHVAVATWLRINAGAGGGLSGIAARPHILLLSYVLITMCLAGLLPNLRINAPRIATLPAAFLTVSLLPDTANHVLLELFCLLFLCFADDSETAECELVIKSLCSVFAIVLFYTGFQKLIYGQYFDGQYLAFSIATETRFAHFLQYVIPADEFERLRNLDHNTVGSGPFCFDVPWLVAASNFIYIVEMGLPVLLQIRKFRTVACLASIALIILIELGAREVLFGVLFISLAALHLENNWAGRLLPVIVGFYIYLIAGQLGLVPILELAY
jgi:hypothetical protein